MSWQEAVFGIFCVVGVVLFFGFMTDNISINIGRKRGEDDNE